MNSMKGQKYRTVKDELPRSVGAQYATGEEWRNNSRKNEETEPKWKQCPVSFFFFFFNAQFSMWLMMEVKSDAVKKNIV